MVPEDTFSRKVRKKSLALEEMLYGDLTGSVSNLVTRALKEFKEITLCLRDPGISSTNNFAGRKISIGSAKDKGERGLYGALPLER